MSQGGSKHKTSEKLPQFRSLALIAVGSNEPFGTSSVAETVNLAISAVAETVGLIRATSRLFRTPAFPAGSGPEFVNAAVALETELSAQGVLAELHRIERDFGRIRETRWGPRTLDLDLIGLGDTILPSLETHQKWANLPLKEQMQTVPDRLILPHPRVHERAFVLVPMLDVAADWVHPVTGLSISRMVYGLPAKQREEVKPL